MKVGYLNSNPSSADGYAVNIWSVQGQGSSGWGTQESQYSHQFLNLSKMPKSVVLALKEAFQLLSGH